MVKKQQKETHALFDDFVWYPVSSWLQASAGWSGAVILRGLLIL